MVCGLPRQLSFQLLPAHFSRDRWILSLPGAEGRAGKAVEKQGNLNPQSSTNVLAEKALAPAKLGMALAHSGAACFEYFPWFCRREESTGLYQLGFAKPLGCRGAVKSQETENLTQELGDTERHPAGG